MNVAKQLPSQFSLTFVKLRQHVHSQHRSLCPSIAFKKMENYRTRPRSAGAPDLRSTVSLDFPFLA